MTDVKSPPCEWKHITHFELSTILDTFEIPDWQRVLSEVHRTTICKAILSNDFYDNAIQVYEIRNGVQKYGVCDGHHRLMALYHLHREFGIKHYALVLQIFEEEYARQIFFRNNLGKNISMNDITKDLDDGTIRFFNHMRGHYEHKPTKTATTFTNLLSAIKFAKDKTPRPLQRPVIEHHIAGITSSDLTYCNKFTRCIKQVSEFVPHSFTYRAPVFRALYRVGFENDLTDEKLKAIIQATIDSRKPKELVKMNKGNEVIAYVYQFITNILCDRIGIPVIKPESITYVTKPGDKQ
jgi:hypothetical protein